VLSEKICGNPTSSSNAFDFEKKQNARVSVFATLDFTSERKSMSTIVSGYKNKIDTLLKGAPDKVLAKCTKYMSLGSEEKMFSSE